MSSDKENTMNEIVNTLNCNPIHKIVLREILKADEDETVKINTVYSKVSQKLAKDPTTIKSILTRIINNMDMDILNNLLGIEKKPKNKEFVKKMSKVIREKSDELDS